jgi:hypothetical protein
MTNVELLARWKTEIVDGNIDPENEYYWESIWVGFVIGAGHPELANYTDYMRLGFPLEA